MGEKAIDDAAVEQIIRRVIDGLKEFAPRPFYTPPQVAKRLGIEPAKVIGWIRRGELVAVNIADRTGGRARWRISEEALAAFLGKRQAVQTPARKKQQPRIIDAIKSRLGKDSKTAKWMQRVGCDC